MLGADPKRPVIEIGQQKYSKEFNMNSKKFLLVIPVVSALVLAAAVGVMAFSSSRAATGEFAVLNQEEDNDQPGPSGTH